MCLPDSIGLPVSGIDARLHGAPVITDCMLMCVCSPAFAMYCRMPGSPRACVCVTISHESLALRYGSDGGCIPAAGFVKMACRFYNLVCRVCNACKVFVIIANQLSVWMLDFVGRWVEHYPVLGWHATCGIECRIKAIEPAERKGVS